MWRDDTIGRKKQSPSFARSRTWASETNIGQSRIVSLARNDHRIVITELVRQSGRFWNFAVAQSGGVGSDSRAAGCVRKAALRRPPWPEIC